MTNKCFYLHAISLRVFPFYRAPVAWPHIFGEQQTEICMYMLDHSGLEWAAADLLELDLFWKKDMKTWHQQQFKDAMYYRETSDYTIRRPCLHSVTPIVVATLHLACCACSGPYRQRDLFINAVSISRNSPKFSVWRQINMSLFRQEKYHYELISQWWSRLRHTIVSIFILLLCPPFWLSGCSLAC